MRRGRVWVLKATQGLKNRSAMGRMKCLTDKTKTMRRKRKSRLLLKMSNKRMRPLLLI